VTTDTNGFYEFSGLRVGTYSVAETQPTGFLDGKDTIGSAGGVTGNDLLSNIILKSGDNSVNNNFGELAPAKISGFVYNDVNDNGFKETGEAPIAGTLLTLTGTDDLGAAVNKTVTTDSNGFYEFSGLRVGTYSVAETQPANFNDGKDSIGSAGGTVGNDLLSNIVLKSGDNSINNNFGELAKPTTASIGDTVWSDCDGDGIQDGGSEKGLKNITVKLLNASGNVVATDVTDANGNYLFDGLTPGDYSISVVSPIGYKFTSQDQGGDDSKDSDVNASGNSIRTTLVAGENDLNWDAGLRPASAGTGASVQFNFNGNSGTDGTDGNILTFTDSASGLSVKASAFSQSKSTGTFEIAYLGTYGGGLGVTDRYEGNGAGNEHTIDNTDGHNNYVLFEFNQNVVLDKAFLGYVAKAAGYSQPDSDLQVWIGNFTDPFNNHLNLNSGVLASSGFTEVNTTTLGTARWADLNAGNFSGNTIVIAADTTDTSPEDMFKLQHLNVATNGIACAPDPARIGDFVWKDSNANGIQDAGELGIANVKVELKNTAGAVIGTTTTDSTGKYGFDVIPGSYSVKVTSPAGLAFTTQNAGADATKNSDVSSTTGETGFFTVAAGQTNNDIDAGLKDFAPPAHIGDFVWKDLNGNGRQDTGEPGIQGVTVQLKNASGNVVSTTTTDHTGKYGFNVEAGSYSIKVVKPSGYNFTSQNTGSNDAIDSDVSSTGDTALYHLAPGFVEKSADAGLVHSAPCKVVSFNFNGNTSTDGTDGNIRTYHDASGLSVKVSAFSESRSNGDWKTAYVGSYGGGLGVTDRYEGNGSGNAHTTDNTGGYDNYILFEFNKTVVLDKAFLGYVSGDSDMQVWIGNSTNVFNNHLTLSDTVLNQAGFSEVNTTTSSSARWVDLNSGNVAGNFLIIAADTTDTSPEDNFKIQNLNVCSTEINLVGSQTCKVDLY
jgi:protocatechuate 3,4-dioxygenase beta subunit